MTPQQKKYLIIGVAGLAVAGIAIYAFRGGDSNGSEVDPTGNGEVIPESTAFDALVTANSLHKAMYQSGTDENKIFAALKNVTPAQFVKVIEKFGLLAYNPVTGNQVNFNPFSNLTKYDLPYWLENELSEASFETLRLKYPNQLS